MNAKNKKNSKNEQGYPFLIIGVLIALVTVMICYFMRPDLLSPRIALSALGAHAPEGLVFSGGFLIVATMILLDGKQTKHVFQRWCRYLIALGFIMIGSFPIEHGELLATLHRTGGLILVLTATISMLNYLFGLWKKIPVIQRIGYGLFAAIAISSVILSILSSSQIRIFALNGLAQYIGLFSLIGWAFLAKAK
jgi:hypothetical protein